MPVNPLDVGDLVGPSPSVLSRDEALRRIRERILRFAASRISMDVAEDLTQEVLILLTTKYAAVTAIEDLMPLSFQIVRLKLMAHRRKARRRGEDQQPDLEPVLETAHDDSFGSSPDEVLRRRELADRLIEAGRKLGTRCRLIFRLKLQGHPFAEIQRVLGAKSINTVYTWDARCRRDFLALLGDSWKP